MTDLAKWILVIEDDRDDFELLQDVFRMSRPEIELRYVEGGEEALAYFKELPPSLKSAPLLILLDLNMPKVDGWQILQEIKSSDALKHIPTIVFTNSNSREEAVKIYKMGANTFIRKPAGFGELKHFVEIFCQYWFQHARLV